MLNRRKTPQFVLKLVQLEFGQVHVLRRPALLKPLEEARQLPNVLRSLAPLLKDVEGWC